MKIVTTLNTAIEEQSTLIIKGDILKSRYGTKPKGVYFCFDNEDIHNLGNGNSIDCASVLLMECGI